MQGDSHTLMLTSLMIALLRWTDPTVMFALSLAAIVGNMIRRNCSSPFVEGIVPCLFELILHVLHGFEIGFKRSY